MQHRHDDLGRRLVLLLVHTDRYSPPVIGNRDRPVGMDKDLDFRAVACKCLVDGVIDDLENHVV